MNHDCSDRPYLCPYCGLPVTPPDHHDSPAACEDARREREEDQP